MPALRSHPHPLVDQQVSSRRNPVCHAAATLLPRSQRANGTAIYEVDQEVIGFATLATVGRHPLMNRASASARACCGIAWRAWRAWQIQFSLYEQRDRYATVGATLCHARSKMLKITKIMAFGQARIRSGAADDRAGTEAAPHSGQRDHALDRGKHLAGTPGAGAARPLCRDPDVAEAATWPPENSAHRRSRQQSARLSASVALSRAKPLKKTKLHYVVQSPQCRKHRRDLLVCRDRCGIERAEPGHSEPGEGEAMHLSQGTFGMPSVANPVATADCGAKKQGVLRLSAHSVSGLSVRIGLAGAAAAGGSAPADRAAARRPGRRIARSAIGREAPPDRGRPQSARLSDSAFSKLSPVFTNTRTQAQRASGRGGERQPFDEMGEMTMPSFLGTRSSSRRPNNMPATRSDTRNSRIKIRARPIRKRSPRPSPPRPRALPGRTTTSPISRSVIALRSKTPS